MLTQIAAQCHALLAPQVQLGVQVLLRDPERFTHHIIKKNEEAIGGYLGHLQTDETATTTTTLATTTCW